MSLLKLRNLRPKVDFYKKLEFQRIEIATTHNSIVNNDAKRIHFFLHAKYIC